MRLFIQRQDKDKILVYSLSLPRPGARRYGQLVEKPVTRTRRVEPGGIGPAKPAQNGTYKFPCMPLKPCKRPVIIDLLIITDHENMIA